MTTKDNGWRERFRGILGNDITRGRLRNEMETFIEQERIRAKIEVLAGIRKEGWIEVYGNKVYTMEHEDISQRIEALTQQLNK